MDLKSKFRFVNHDLDYIKSKNLYRKLNSGIINGSFITIKKKKIINLCSNDYLGIKSSNIQLKQLQSSSRLVSGEHPVFEKLEKKLAKHKSQQQSLIFPTGYMTNLGVISAIIKKGDQILSDKLNHASIIEACKLSEGKVSTYDHNNIQDLKLKLKSKQKRKFIITEGIFSMDGDLANLKEISEIAEKTDSILILDDAHGDFVIGNDGKGTANHLGVSKKIDIYISSLSKGLGSFGGYVSSQKNVIELCVNKSKSFIYTSALPSFLVENSLNRFNFNREPYRKKLENNVKHMINGLIKIGYEINSNTHIIPIIIGSEKHALNFGKYLLRNGIYAQPIRYPTVSKNKARIRISVTGWLSKTQINEALTVFEKAGKRFKII